MIKLEIISCCCFVAVGPNIYSFLFTELILFIYEFPRDFLFTCFVQKKKKKREREKKNAETKKVFENLDISKEGKLEVSLAILLRSCGKKDARIRERKTQVS